MRVLTNVCFLHSWWIVDSISCNRHNCTLPLTCFNHDQLLMRSRAGKYNLVEVEQDTVKLSGCEVTQIGTMNDTRLSISINSSYKNTLDKSIFQEPVTSKKEIKFYLSRLQNSFTRKCLVITIMNRNLKILLKITPKKFVPTKSCKKYYPSHQITCICNCLNFSPMLRSRNGLHSQLLIGWIQHESFLEAKFSDMYFIWLDQIHLQ